jgi:hypothetical protein
MALMAVVECQFHTALPEQEHTRSSPSHPGSATHSLLDFSCMGLTAVLPLIVLFAALLFQVWHTTPLVLKPVVLVLLPFIPPRTSTRQAFRA